MVSQDFLRQIKGYGLTTARIWYRLPDNKEVINPNPFIWQFDDIFPEFPRLNRFLLWWQRECAGPLHSVEVSHRKLITPAEIRSFEGDNIFRLN
ncbi:hypothetical protein C4556_02065 [Candidatus Parcubacteria bacterium]|nr:MAG: hypothetical protein C4556_02065 [Candidatus Parcubacteria bacterium]